MLEATHDPHATTAGAAVGAPRRLLAKADARWQRVGALSTRGRLAAMLALAATGLMLLLVGQFLAGTTGLVGAFLLVVVLNAGAAALSGVYDPSHLAAKDTWHSVSRSRR
jgi:hypothetical protein